MSGQGIGVTMEPRELAPHVLRALARHQIDGRRATLETLVDEIGVRRADLRRTVTALHEQGYLDVASLRLTLNGFALGVRLVDRKLPLLRVVTRVGA